MSKNIKLKHTRNLLLLHEVEKVSTFYWRLCRQYMTQILVPGFEIMSVQIIFSLLQGTYDNQKLIIPYLICSMSLLRFYQKKLILCAQLCPPRSDTHADNYGTWWLHDFLCSSTNKPIRSHGLDFRTCVVLA